MPGFVWQATPAPGGYTLSPPWNPTKKGEEFEFEVGLEDCVHFGRFRENPTIASGDVKVSKDDGALADLEVQPYPHSRLEGRPRAPDGRRNERGQGDGCVFRQPAPSDWADPSISFVTTA